MAKDRQTEEELFLSALEMPPQAREAFLREACKERPELKRAVEALLLDHQKATALFDEAEQDLDFNEEAIDSDSLEAGAKIGVYRLLRPLGTGGAGLVYEAEQESPVRRKVALKLFKLDLDQRRIRERFEAERQTLALMEHPNIARVLDAGSTETGRPYFVMDLVHGVRITEYCREHKLPLAASLRLLQQVCSAVQHAHQKGVIHQDLKPSNILVSEIDGVPIPKVIDFGIARVLDKSGTDNNDSKTFPLLGTPAYMSPEQFQGPDMDVDTRSDIYSLGVVMYELLVGRPPFETEDLSPTGLAELRRRIVDESPRRPSALRPGLSPELDWVLLRALEKDREQRYATVRALSEDLEYFLANRPLAAHPASPWYRLGKWVRRNRFSALAGSVALLTLVAGFGTSTLLYLRAKAAEKEQAQLRVEAEERAHVTRAAILLMQNRLEEADAEIRRMGGVLTQASVEASHVFRSLGVWSAMNGDWKSSSARWLALSRVNRYDDRDMTDNATRDLLPVAPTLLISGAVEDYENFRDLLISRLGRSNNPIAAEQVLKICLQYPTTPRVLSGLSHIASVAEQSLPGGFEATPRTWLDAWRCITLGLWQLRNGRYQEAISWCDRALLLKDDEEARQTIALLTRALARRGAGIELEKAEEDLRQATLLVEHRFETRLDYGTRGYWHDWLSAKLLLKEAGELFDKSSLKSSRSTKP